MESKFAKNLKQLRREHMCSQSKLAATLGVTQQCVSEWELDKTEPTLSYLVMIADAFDISLDILCGRKDW